MKKTYKIGIAALVLTTITTTAIIANNNVFAAPVDQVQINIVKDKYINGQDVIKG